MGGSRDGGEAEAIGPAGAARVSPAGICQRNETVSPLRALASQRRVDLKMDDYEAPTGVRRAFLRALAYVRVGIWMVQEVNPWRRRYGKRK
jgi:hypothetical protein